MSVWTYSFLEPASSGHCRNCTSSFIFHEIFGLLEIRKYANVIISEQTNSNKVTGFLNRLRCRPGIPWAESSAFIYSAEKTPSEYIQSAEEKGSRNPGFVGKQELEGKLHSLVTKSNFSPQPLLSFVCSNKAKTASGMI